MMRDYKINLHKYKSAVKKQYNFTTVQALASRGDEIALFYALFST